MSKKEKSPTLFNTEMLKTWSEYSGKTVKELKAMKKVIEKALKGKGLEGEKLESVVLAEWARQIRTQKFSKTKLDDYVGFILGTSSAWDRLETLRRKALAVYRRDPMEAQLQGLTDANGTPLDSRESLFGGTRKNSNYHKPLIANEWTRVLYGIAKRVKDGSGPKVWQMWLRGRAAKQFRYRAYRPLNFKAITKGDTQFFSLNPSKSTKFEVTQNTIDIEGWVRKQEIVRIDELREAYEIRKALKNKWLFCEGTVDRINMTVNPKTGSRSFILADAQRTAETVRVFINEDFPIGFSEYSKVIVMGRGSLWKRNEGDEVISINAFSVYPLPGQGVVFAEEEDMPDFMGSGGDDYIIPFIDEEEIKELADENDF